MLTIPELDYTKGGGFVTVVAQDALSGAVLMVAHADQEALEHTVRTGELHLHSRTRGLWHKGATSGNTLRVLSWATDCDGDALLVRVAPAGPACHTGSTSCFGEMALTADMLSLVDAVIAARAADLRDGETGDGSSYTQRLLADRNLRLKKIGEEAVELAVACADGDAARAADEGADLMYHALVALRGAGVSLAEVRRVLGGRMG